MCVEEFERLRSPEKTNISDLIKHTGQSKFSLLWQDLCRVTDLLPLPLPLGKSCTLTGNCSIWLRQLFILCTSARYAELFVGSRRPKGSMPGSCKAKKNLQIYRLSMRANMMQITNPPMSMHSFQLLEILFKTNLGEETGHRTSDEGHLDFDSLNGLLGFSPDNQWRYWGTSWFARHDWAGLCLCWR